MSTATSNSNLTIGTFSDKISWRILPYCISMKHSVDFDLFIHPTDLKDDKQYWFWALLVDGPRSATQLRDAKCKKHLRAPGSADDAISEKSVTFCVVGRPVACIIIFRRRNYDGSVVITTLPWCWRRILRDAIVVNCYARICSVKITTPMS